MDSIRIRKADMHEAPAIARFNRQMAQETEGKKLPEELTLRGVKAVLKDAHKGFYLVAVTDDAAIVGQLLITFEWSDWRNGNFWWIQSVYVDPAYRQQKIFSRLFRHLKELARFHKEVVGLRLYVEKNNQLAKDIYERLDMIQTPYEMYELLF